jgi:hypothetical protein
VETSVVTFFEAGKHSADVRPETLLKIRKRAFRPTCLPLGYSVRRGLARPYRRFLQVGDIFYGLHAVSARDCEFKGILQVHAGTDDQIPGQE